jgi:flagellar motor switch protein FliM
MRKKLAAARLPDGDGGPGADRSWRLTLARAARDAAKLALDVTSLTLQKMGLVEVLELVPDLGLIAVLQGPAESLGVLVLSPEVLASVVEVQTIGKVNRSAPPTRKPTRTDAAMSAGLIDAALSGLDVALEDEADLSWAGGYRYGSHLEDARPLGLLLEDRDYNVLLAQVSLGLGQREGLVILALPAEGRGRKPLADEATDLGPAPHHVFAEELAERIEGATCVMRATLARLSLPLGEITELAEGMVLPLRQCSIDRIRLEGLDGRIVGEGRLGQNRGMRAIRLVEKPGQAGSRPAPLTGSGSVAAPGAPLSGTALAAMPQPAAAQTGAGQDRLAEPLRAAV